MRLRKTTLGLAFLALALLPSGVSGSTVVLEDSIVRITDPRTGETRTILKNGQGEPIRDETVDSEGRPIWRIERTFDDQGRLIRVIRWSRSEGEQVHYSRKRPEEAATVEGEAEESLEHRRPAAVASREALAFTVPADAEHVTLYEKPDPRASESSAAGNPLGFHDLIHDEATGLVYVRNRWYSPDLGIFLTPDPLGYVDGPNLYQYARRNPVNYHDPFGLSTQAVMMMTDTIVPPALATDLAEVDAVREAAWRGATVDVLVGLWEAPGALGTGLGYCAGDLAGCPGNAWELARRVPDSFIYAMRDPILRARGLGGMWGGALFGAGGASWLTRPYLRVADWADPTSTAPSPSSTSALQAERLRAQLAALELENAPRVDSALKPDAQHRAASFVIDQLPERGRVFVVRGGDGIERTLVQLEGRLNDRNGVFEWIIDPGGNVTHQRFIPGGQLTGTPNQPGR